MPDTLSTEIANGASSNNRAETNRENAQKSTGPRTVAGKQRSSLNALRHGLTGQTVVLPTDDLSAYQRHCKEFLDQYLPKNKMEVQLTQTIADLTWRLNRITAIEADLLTMGVDPENNQDTADMSLVFRQQGQVMANLSMYERRLSVRFKETLNQLREIQAERVAQEASEMFDAANKI